ncbi:MAG: putative S-adenosylmethionine-dependent methyltransferase [candidate division WS2 bacterium]|uniref:S-adenosylmethionine-dependent methyltransferase n=1 Tax=Psychracetigena formicireducens TaxID=2986056 RepID=A0A9E2BJ67_PSYF1|nr:putative S-adenosylmethionine-dependent methyltransferase [Candidatus Psychracetigena formicireducens]
MKTQEHWEEEARRRLQSLARGEELFASYWTKRYLENLKYLPGGERILDIGCGDAKYFFKLTDKFNEFYGVELSKVHFESAKNVFPEATYIVAGGSKLPFQDSSFETIISFGAFEHNEDIGSIFKECYRVLKEGGVLLFSVPNYVSPYFPYLYISHAMKGHERIAAIGHHYTKKQLISALKEQGFREIKIVDSIYAAPVPVVGLVAGLAARLIKKMCNPRSYANPVTEEREHPQGDKIEKLRGIVKNLDYLYSKAFYPFERFGFGFMRVIYCEK